MIKVLLADDHQLFIDGMKALLERAPEIEVVAEASDGQQVLEQLESIQVDVIILDIEMPNLDGVAATEFIRKKYPKTKVLIVTMYNKKEFIVNLMKYGASGYILKNRTKEELLQAIHTVYRGGSHYTLEVLDTATSIDESFPEEGKLTEREEEVLCKIAEGLTSKEMAALLFISETTVNTHRRNILSKLNLPNATSLVRYAIKNGYVEL